MTPDDSLPPAAAAPPPRRLADLRARVITAVVAIPLVLGAIIWVPEGWGHLFFCLLVCGAALREYLGMMRIGLLQPITVVMFVISLLLFGLASAYYQLGISMVGYLPLLMFLFPALGITVMFEAQNNRPFQQIGTLMVALIYLVVPLLLFFISGFRMDRPEATTLLDLANPQFTYSWQRPLGILLCTWVADTSAYFAGKYLGRTKIWPRISPGKSWEGAVGALAGVLLLGWGLNLWLTSSDANWLVLGPVLMVFGLLGDMLESLLKRTVYRKDSGGILPGHGGVLDRFDGLFLAMPFASAYFYWVAITGA